MNNKDLYKVTVAKNGEPVTVIETDCIIAAINDVDGALHDFKRRAM